MAFVVKSATLNVAASTLWSIQPAAGEQWLITMYGGHVTQTGAKLVTGGGASPNVSYPNIAGTAGGTVVKIFSTNTVYFALYNFNAGSAEDMGYCGVLL